MSKSRNLADLLDANGDVKVGALDNITVDDEVAIGATAPSSPVEGQVWYDTNLDILKSYDGSVWNKVSPIIPTIISISGSVVVSIGGNITITGTGFLSDECSVEFSGSFTTTSVNATASSDTSLVVAVPAAAYASIGTVAVKVINSDNGQSSSSTFSIAGLPTGGTITTSGSYRIHTFNSSSTFVNTIDNLSVEYLVIAGAGGGGQDPNQTSYQYQGGGGAGGYRSSVTGESSGGGTSAESPLSLASGSYTVTVGGGGGVRTNGSNSVFHTITSLGGGCGASGGGSSYVGLPGTGGSGGGGANTNPWNGTNTNAAGGSGTAGQGYAGGSGYISGSAAGNGGGGAGGVGQVTPSGNHAAYGGSGVASSITGSSVTRAVGGLAVNDGNYGNGSSGGANTGTGGASLYSGGSGIVIVRYQV